MRVGLVVPHIFMHQDILPKVIFSPGKLAIDLADELTRQGIEVTLITPGPVSTQATNLTADLSYFEAELAARGDDYLDLLKKHPLTFITLARQVQSEIIAKAYAMANNDELDIVHIYTNEEDTALPFAQLCSKPVVFTHHDPFNFMAKYRSLFPKYTQLNWLSMSMAQRKAMPDNTNWLANVYHGLSKDMFTPSYSIGSDYILYMGRVIKDKGVHLAIEAVKQCNQTAKKPYKLKIAGKHYTGNKDSYWQKQIAPQIDNINVEYVGFVEDTASKQALLANAAGLVIPSLFDEPFGLVTIEALACGTPVIGVNSGAISEVLSNPNVGAVVERGEEGQIVTDLAKAFTSLTTYDRKACRQEFEARFTLERMSQQHIAAYKSLIK